MNKNFLSDIEPIKDYIKNYVEKKWEKNGTLYLYDNSFDKKALQQLHENKSIKYRLITDHNQNREFGFLKNIDEKQSKFKQFKELKWENIPMFSVLTGVNGIGKSSILKYIEKGCRLLDHSGYGLELDETISSVPAILIIDNEVINRSHKQNVYEKDMYRNVMQLDFLADITYILRFLRDDIEKLSNFLTKKDFKYKWITFTLDQQSHIRVNKLNEKQVFLHEEKPERKNEQKNEKVAYANLSPGERSIFTLLIWQYMFKERAYMVKNAIMLFDEPDSHLHPSKVKYWIEELKYLSKLNVQIIITTHNPTTVSFIEKENI